MVDFSGIKLPFNVPDLINSGITLLGLVGGFVLLGLAFHFAPRVIHLIRYANAGYRHYNSKDASEWSGGIKPSKINIYKKSLYRAQRDVW